MCQLCDDGRPQDHHASPRGSRRDFLKVSAATAASAAALSLLSPSAAAADPGPPTFFPWKDTKEKIPLAVRHVRTFLKANRPA